MSNKRSCPSPPPSPRLSKRSTSQSNAMANGNVIKSRRRSGKASYRRSGSSRKALTAAQSKAVSKIAKSVTMKVAETKTLSTFWGSLMYDHLLSSINPIYQFSQGTTAESIVGEKIYIDSLDISGYMYAAIAATANCQVRHLVVHARDKLHTGAQSTVTKSSVFKDNGRPITDFIDTHKVDVVFDQMQDIHPDFTGQVSNAVFKFNVPIRRTKYFDADSSGYFKDGQYFYIQVVYDGRGTASNYWGTNFATQVNIKDV